MIHLISPAFSLVAIAGLVLGVSGSGSDLESQTLPAVSKAVPTPGPDSAVVMDADPILEEMARGRHWHAARLIRATRDSALVAGDPATVLLLAEAEAGWANWEEVEALLDRPLSEGELEDARGWYLLGRAREALEMWVDAADAYDRFLEMGPSLGGPPERSAGGDESLTREVLARRVRAGARGGDLPGALESLSALSAADSVLGDWEAAEVAEVAAVLGETEATRMALSAIGSPEVRGMLWDVPGRALLARGDSAGAEAVFWSVLPSLASPDRARAWTQVGALRLARGDSVGARGSFHQVLQAASTGPDALRAARALLKLGFDSLDVALTGAQVLAASGTPQEALRGYEAFGAILGRRPPPAVRLAVARVRLASGQAGAALEEASELGEMEDPAVGAPALLLKIQALRRLGRASEVRAVEDVLVEHFPDLPEAVEILFLRADALQDRGDIPAAITGFQAAAALSPAQNLAGQARMRLGQIFLTRGQTDEALRIYGQYLDDFPDGRRWDEAAFWLGRVLASSSRTEEGEAVLEDLIQRNPLSYYAVEGSRLLGRAYDPAIPRTAERPPSIPELEAGLRRIEALLSADLTDGAGREIDGLMTRLREMPDSVERQEGLLRLAGWLNARGFTREGINLGWELRREGRPWDDRLLSAVYPFPFQELIETTAEERGLDPYLMAGLIRQESAFWAEARSRADARGLMQVLPSTGVELARGRGPSGFEPGLHLYVPEINVHLGTAFFADLRRRFGDQIPILLSAYNAGPTRALRWREFPEVGDWVRFVERVPFSETRGYIRNVTLNREIYAWLYGRSRPSPLAPPG
jgi:soluble lytic murein transglycosylase